MAHSPDYYRGRASVHREDAQELHEKAARLQREADEAYRQFWMIAAIGVPSLLLLWALVLSSH
jgi:hypothetical protein